MSANEEREYLTTRQVAARMNVGRAAVNWMVKRGELTPHKRTTELGTDYHVFAAVDVEALAAQRQAAAEAPRQARAGRRPRAPRPPPTSEEAVNGRGPPENHDD